MDSDNLAISGSFQPSQYHPLRFHDCSKTLALRPGACLEPHIFVPFAPSSRHRNSQLQRERRLWATNSSWPWLGDLAWSFSFWHGPPSIWAAHVTPPWLKPLGSIWTYWKEQTTQCPLTGTFKFSPRKEGLCQHPKSPWFQIQLLRCRWLWLREGTLSSLQARGGSDRCLESHHLLE